MNTNQLFIRKSTPEDLPVIMTVYEKAKTFMREHGNHAQWTGGYPSEAVILNDMAQDNHYVGLTEDGDIAVVFAFIVGADPTYSHIEGGEWLNDEPYGTIHRIASAGMYGGVTERVVDYCFTLVDNIRIDTHSDNTPMQDALNRMGFSRCGIIYISDGTPRVAFQKKNR